MQKLPMYIFEDENEVGIHKVPNGSVVVVRNFNGTGKSVQIMKSGNGSLNSSSTINDFLGDKTLYESYLPTPTMTGNQGKWLKTDGVTSSWEEVFSYDDSTKTLTINL